MGVLMTCATLQATPLLTPLLTLPPTMFCLYSRQLGCAAFVAPMLVVRRYTREQLPEHWKRQEQVQEAMEDVQVGTD